MNNIIKLHEFKNNRSNLYLFPHAGSLPTQYQKWSKPFSAYLNVLYINTEKENDINQMIKSIQSGIQQTHSPNSIFLGHSMGSLIAFLTCYKLGTNPSLLVLSGMNAPSSRSFNRFKEMAELPMDIFTKRLIKFGGIPNELIKSPELLSKFTQKSQADFRLLSQLNLSDFKSLDLRAHLLGANKDPLTQISEILKWSKFLHNSPAFKLFDGNHFYLFNSSNKTYPFLIELFQEKAKI